MEDDNVMPNDGSYFLPREPQEQILDRKKERAKTLELLKVTERLLQHFDERIADRDSIDAITVKLDADPLLFQKAFEVNRLLKMALIEEKELLIEQIEMYGPK